MNCRVCGSKMSSILTDLPFKIEQHSIIIIKNIPVLQCENCGNYEIRDEVMEHIDTVLKKVGKGVEVEILSYAA